MFEAVVLMAALRVTLVVILLTLVVALAVAGA